MNCPNCGNVNNEGSQNCMYCGASFINNAPVNNQGNVMSADSFNSVPVQNVDPNVVNNGVMYQAPVEQVQYQTVEQNLSSAPVQNVNYNAQVVNAPVVNVNTSAEQPNKQPAQNLNFINYIINAVIKPADTFEKDENNLSDPKNSLLLALIVTGAMTIINLIVKMFSSIFVKRIDYATYEYKTAIDFSEILDLNYLELIFRDFFIYAGFVAFIALIFYLGSLIIKKPSNYLKMVSIAATALIPYAIGSTFIVPLLTAIWASLGSIASILITVYTVTIFIALINKEIKIEKLDNRIYFNLASISVLFYLGYFVLLKIIF